MKRRLFRILVNGLTLLSLLLCVATCVLWARSYYRETNAFWRAWDDSGEFPLSIQYQVSAYNGALLVGTSKNFGPRDFDADGPVRQDAPSPLGFSREPVRICFSVASNTSTGSFWERMGFSADHDTVSDSSSNIQTESRQVPIWPLALLLSILPALFTWTRLRRRSRINQNVCLTCGYDLRATPDRCPECGTVPKRAAATVEDTVG